jgi:protein-S-isoprenylcysteine O-methyltransferase Ste14
MRRFWIVFGVANHAFFVFTVTRLFPFLQGTNWPRGGHLAQLGRSLPWFWTDALLALQFGVIHSALLLPSTRKRLQRFVPSPQFGCVFCAASCLSLLLAIEGWHSSPRLLWRLNGLAGGLVTGAFLLSWVGLFYSLHLTGLGFQTGWTTWWAWVKQRPIPRRSFEPRGAYRLLRHPVYLSFLGLVWFTPVMSYDRATLVVIWTAYIFVGSYLKDLRLLHYVGEPYRAYKARVPGYPLLPFGALARVKATKAGTAVPPPHVLVSTSSRQTPIDAASRV